MKRIVLIIGTDNDPHVKRVTECLLTLGAEPVVFDIEADRISLSIRSGSVGGYVTVAGRTFAFDKIYSVWDRFKRWCDHSIRDPHIRSEVRFAWSEKMDAIASLYHYVSPSRWINPISQRIVSSKAVQHVIAASVGLSVPNTVVTNDIDAVTMLFDMHDRVVYKANESGDFTGGRVLFTTEVDRSVIMNSRAQIHLAPGIFQELVEKDHELRVTVVGDEIFAVRIDSQSNEKTGVDWRRDIMNEQMYSAVSIDPSLRTAILDFHKAAELVYGAYDIVVTKEGHPVFLEVNPAGQWMHYENLFGFPISMEMANRLTD